MSRVEEKYRPAIAGKKIPIVILDHKWHQLFTRIEKSKKVIETEKELNELLRRQGKCNTESVKIKKLKKKLMDEIVSMMDRDDASSNKKREENKRLIDECNDKIMEYQDELIDIPIKINEVNTELMLETMRLCYDNLHENEEQISVIGKWIADIRIELKKNVVRKQEMEIANQEIYSFMHDIFGADVIDLFDMKYNPQDKKTIHIKEQIMDQEGKKKS